MTEREMIETEETAAARRGHPVEPDGDMQLEERVHDEDIGDNVLLPDDATDDFRGRWESIQATFVDEPREAVSRADTLVGEVMDRLRTMFEDQRQRLDAGGADDDEASTEDLRLALRRYRSFFERLLRA